MPSGNSGSPVYVDTPDPPFTAIAVHQSWKPSWNDAELGTQWNRGSPLAGTYGNPVASFQSPDALGGEGVEDKGKKMRRLNVPFLRSPDATI